MPDPLRAAALDYLDALDRSRQPYVQAARNAPTEREVHYRKVARLAAAEQALRDAATTEES